MQDIILEKSRALATEFNKIMEESLINALFKIATKKERWLLMVVYASDRGMLYKIAIFVLKRIFGLIWIIEFFDSNYFAIRIERKGKIVYRAEHVVRTALGECGNIGRISSKK